MPDTFTPEQIAQILEEFFKVVGTRQYIGARYVPIFGRKDEESIEWDNTAPYEPLTIVLYQGNSFTSRQYVPVGVDINNTEFWANTGNYNAQVEQYRRDVNSLRDEVAEYVDRIDQYENLLPSADFSETDTVKKYIDNSVTNINASIAATNALLPSSEFSSENTVKKYVDDSIINNTTLVGKKAIVYTDSTFTENTNVPNVGETGVLCDMLEEVTGMDIDNRGVGGETLSGLLTRLNNTTADTFVGYDYVFVCYSTNDWQSSTPIWWNDGNTYSFEYRLNAVFDRFEALAPLARLIFVTPAYAHRMFTGANNYNANTSEANYNVRGFNLEDYVDMCLKVCRERRVRCIDLFHTMNVNETNYQQYMVRSSYNTSHEFYDIWVHYSKFLKELIAHQFLYAYPYAIPAYPYDVGSENYIETNNITLDANYSTSSPAAFDFVDSKFMNRYGAGVGAATQYIARAYFTGNDTLMCQVKEPCYIQINNADSSVSKRFYIVHQTGVTCLNVKGLHGMCLIYVNARSNAGVNGGQSIAYNLRVYQGRVAYKYGDFTPIVKKSSFVYHLDVTTNPTRTVYVQETVGSIKLWFDYVSVSEAITGGTNIVYVPATGFKHDDNSPMLFPVAIYRNGNWESNFLMVTGANNKATGAINIGVYSALSQGDIICGYIEIPKMLLYME